MKYAQEWEEWSKTLYKDTDVRNFELVGSALYLPDPKDLDILVLVSDLVEYLEKLKQLEENDEKYSSDGWKAVRIGDVNLLITEDRDWFVAVQKAAWICAGLGLTERKDRVLVHEILRGEVVWADGKPQRMP